MEDVKALLLVLGDFAWDLLIRTNSELLPGGDTFGEILLVPGGTAANVAVGPPGAGSPPASSARSAATALGSSHRTE